MDDANHVFALSLASASALKLSAFFIWDLAAMELMVASRVVVDLSCCFAMYRAVVRLIWPLTYPCTLCVSTGGENKHERARIIMKKLLLCSLVFVCDQAIPWHAKSFFDKEV